MKRPLVKAGPVGPDTLRFQLDDLISACEQHCRFCPRSFDQRRPAPGGAELEARVRDRFQQALAMYPQRDVVLLSSDILRWPDLFGLLDLAAAAARRVTLLTPGLDLDDPAFADRFIGRPVRFDLTWLAGEPEAWARVTGRADSFARVDAAVRNLRARGLPFRLSTVVTRDNVDVLPETLASAAAHGVRHFTVRMFYPDYAQPKSSYYDQFPTFEQLGSALARAAALDLDLTVDLTNTPWCQIDLAAIAPLRVFMRAERPPQNTHPTDGLAACATCAVSHTCVRVHTSYLERHAAGVPAAAQIQANLDHSAQLLASLGPERDLHGRRTEGWVAPTPEAR